MTELEPKPYKQRQRNTTDPEDSILNSGFQEPERPYSQNELKQLFSDIHKRFRLSSIYVGHDCKHKYLVKQNGKRYQEILDEYQDTKNGDIVDVGNCSVCWKRHDTPRQLRDLVDEVIELYDETFEYPRLSYFNYVITKVFYTWLYNEHYNNKK